MSNAIVGEVYRQIMDRILQAAENDFEEGGYAPDTLTDLRTVWQENLSKLHVAQMPWDPKPAPVVKPEDAHVAGNGTLKPEIKYDNQASSQSSVKPESQGGAAYASMNGYAGGGVNPMAQERAHNNLLQRFGPQANASIQAAGLNVQRQPNQNGSPSQGNQPTPQIKQPDVKPNVSDSQTDGAGDWREVVDLTRDFEPQRAAADGFFRSQMNLEDDTANAGLMLNTPANRAAIRKLHKHQQRQSKRQGQSIPQVDGEDEDEDAINSDLDDSEDEMQDEEEDDEGPLGEMILCTWDKVNRVKNKWKCTLKDGVLATGGKEYVFLKATGEFEW